MVNEAGLVRFGRVRREEQEAVGAGGFGGLCVLDGLRSGTAGGGQDRDDAADLIDGGADHPLGFGRSEGEALTGAAGCEEARHREAGLPREVLAVDFLIELQVGVESGHREGQQAFLDGVCQFLRGVLCHDVVLCLGAAW